MTQNLCIIGIFCVALAGCQGGGGSGPAANATGNPNTQFSPNTPNPPATNVLAYLDGRPISHNDLQAALYETAGGIVLAELIIDRNITKKLAERGVTLSAGQIEAEKAALLKSLDPNNDDQAVRLLRELRKRRGLGDVRFEQLLKRNAGMRLLIQDEVKVTEPEVKQAYEIEYGPRYEVRMIMVDTLSLASELVKKARGDAGVAPVVPVAGESFIDLAVKYSTDPSRVQGGLLAPVSPADPTWPDGIRKAVVLLEEGKIGDPIAIEKGFAILRLERKIPAKPIQFEAARQELTTRVRRNSEQAAMQRLARAMLSEGELIVTDRTLRESWTLQKEQMYE